ncbi:MAG: nucleotidyltransferase [bacterium]|nr:nucleotidyltransferase [bacterium]
MKIIGIICEYNPFHNGHLYHLKKVKEIFPNSLIVLIMSGSFTQRGIPSILNKWDKTEIALIYGIDLVIELPFPFATQSADLFAKGAISLLKEVKAEYLVFGSESNDVNTLQELADIALNNKKYQEKIRQYLKKGMNYPTALSKALESFSKKTITTPNDLLAFSYIKEIKKQHANITPISIQRTNNYHDINLKNIASATSIRLALLEKKDITNYVPIEVVKQTKNSCHFLKNYFPFLKYKIETTDDLGIFQTVDEGIENRIKKQITEAISWEDLVTRIKTKRYTYNKINRMLTHILCNFTKEKAEKFQHIEYIRVLGFSTKGQAHLRAIKKMTTVPIITTFSTSKSEMLKYEQVITNVYTTILNEPDKIKQTQAEYQSKPKKRDK